MAGHTLKPRRSGKKIAAWVVAGLTALVVLAAAIVYLRLNSNLSTFDGDGISKDRPDAGPPDAVNLLLIGSDSREGGNRDLGGGQEGGARSDTTILLHVYADHRHAVGVSIPRDSLVDVPSCKLPNGSWTKPQTGVMFNSAFEVGNSVQGNPACTQNTVEKLTNLRIDHTLVVDFQGFAAMTDAVGGVEVCLPKEIHEGDLDPNLGHPGKVVFAKGRQRVQGQAALDYVRVRHGLGDGSDIGRTKRQQAFLSSLFKDVKAKGMDPGTLLPLADAATRSLTVDPGLGSAQKLLAFATSLRNVDLHDVKFLTAPWRYQGARVALVHPDADQLWQALKADRTLDGQDAGAPGSASPSAAAPSDTPAPPPPAAVTGTGTRVAVYNGTTTAGLSTRAAAVLAASDFTVTGRANAASLDHATTVVQYGPGEEAKARLVAKLFPGATLEPTRQAGLNLILGRDFAVGGAPAAAASVPPGPLPSSVAAAARSADEDPCSDLTYG